MHHHIMVLSLVVLTLLP